MGSRTRHRRRRIRSLAIAVALAFVFFNLGRRMGLPLPMVQFLIIGTLLTIYVRGRKRLLGDPEEGTLTAAPEESTPVSELRRTLQSAAAVGGVDERMQRAARQVTTVQELFDAFDRVLNARLNKTELTYERYRRPAESLYLGVLDNLQAVATTARRLVGSDVSHVEERLSALAGDTSEAARIEREALEERRKLREEGTRRIDALLAFNERALTAIAAVTGAVDAMSTGQEGAVHDLEGLVGELKGLSAQASKY